MAFSYSDKNFTVVGNLCFVHIILDGTKDTYEIPPAIADRMLFNNILCFYPFLTKNKAIANRNIGYAHIISEEIILSGVGVGYLYCYFPIDSNK